MPNTWTLKPRCVQRSDCNSDRDAPAMLRSAIDHQNRALADAPNDQDAKTHLMEHYAQLLRCQVRQQQWRSAKVTAEAYRQVADGDAQRLLAVASDLAEATKLTPQGRQRERSVSAVALALASARDAGLKLEPSILDREPFLALAEEPRLRKVVRP